MSTPTPEEQEALTDLLMDQRDAYPRHVNDIPSDILAVAILAAGYRLPVPERGKSIAARIVYDAAVNNRAREIVEERALVSAAIQPVSSPVQVTDASHQWVRIHAERVGEISLYCACGLAWKHLPLARGQHADLPACPAVLEGEQ